MTMCLILLGLAALAVSGLNQAFHLCGYYGTQTASAVNVALPSIPDSIMTRAQSGNLISPQPASIIMGYAGGATLSNARLNTPKYRSISLPSLVPINTTLAVPSPYNLVDLIHNPMPINAVDELEVDTSNSAGATDVEAALLWLQYGMVPYIPGTIIRCRATAAVTCVNGTWVNGVMTLDQTLPAGVYAVLGLLAWGTNLLAARLVFPSGAYRPGSLATNAAGGWVSPIFNKQGLGCWGSFESVNLPSVDCLGIGSCTAQTFFLDLVYQSGTQLLGVN